MLLPYVAVTEGNAFEEWDRWMKTGVQQLGYYLYHDDEQWFVLPKLDIHQSARRIRHAVASGRAAGFYQEMFSHWPISGPVAYVTAELLWDPRQDVDELMDQYCRDLFGPAQEPMRAFYQTLEAGYERWLAVEGIPYQEGKDVAGSINANSMEQFRVLSPNGASQAWKFLIEAKNLARTEPKVSERLQIIELMFGLEKLGVETYWMMDRAAGGVVESEEEARQRLAATRNVFALVAEMRNYITNMLGSAPKECGVLFGGVHTKKNTLYEQLRSGEANLEVMAAANRGIDAVADYLRKNLNPEDAIAWWGKEAHPDEGTYYSSVLQMGKLRTKPGPGRTLFVADYDRMANELFPEHRAESDILLARGEQEGKFAIRHWFPNMFSKNARCVLTRNDALGHYALRFEQCHRMRLDAAVVKAGAGDFLRISFGFKRNAAPGEYSAVVQARLAGGSDVDLALMPIPKKPDDWHEVCADIVMPKDSKAVIARFYVGQQAPDARCWFGNFRIKR